MKKCYRVNGRVVANEDCQDRVMGRAWIDVAAGVAQELYGTILDYEYPYIDMSAKSIENRRLKSLEDHIQKLK